MMDGWLVGWFYNQPTLQNRARAIGNIVNIQYKSVTISIECIVLDTETNQPTDHPIFCSAKKSSKP